MSSDKREWVVKPDEANIELAIGREAKLSPEVRSALDALMRALEAEQDVQGYGQCQDVAIGDCDAVFSCKGVVA
jgi:hypothetical protein